MSATTVRVMTWNLWWRFGPQWVDRQEAILATLRAVGPDVVAVQEAWPEQVETLAEQLGMHCRYAGPSYPPETDIARGDDPVSLGMGLLSRWPIADWKVRTMPARHRQLEPVAVVASLDHPQVTLHVVTSCLEYEPAFTDDRIAQTRLLAELATDPAYDGDAPVIVAGDLNAGPTSRVLGPLYDVLRDAWTGDPDAITSPDEAGPDLRDQRIDHIFYRPGTFSQEVEVTQAQLAGDPVDGITPSDHQAVVCDLRW
ncbi:Endonuclease/exonuclease/phosphatase [Kribbella flavida DSM 17836]|uniref:Endonuclease/exonuclease/phosphatase n=1 Tax=Kribbella flavida (strain DSM 17836 / JCM 10339 / NBRC 14399) TaxID=479435 RepID=D2PUV7_KRIFD|nr:endonuclease/exonuclease/phosphatase family protein [Kribbella flavida]ADB31423.1 Endonuclease/exonuclease/phosphatase [Kribbella flavida DSM 17836]